MAQTFDAVWRQAYLDQLRTLLPGRCPVDLEILPLDETIAALGHDGEEDLGRQEVPVAAIVGTVARAADFDRRFRPRNRHLRDRWDMVAGLQRDLPPVSLVRLNDFYFVADGHHRVSVARARGMATIRADVRRICTVVCANRCLTVADLPRKAAERCFLERVPLPEDVRVALTLDDPSQWRRLADAAEAWGFRQTLAGRELADRCALAEAWWAEEVGPLLEDLGGRGICAGPVDLQTYIEAIGAGSSRI